MWIVRQLTQGFGSVSCSVARDEQRRVLVNPTMIYVKSIFAGIVAAFSVVALRFVGIVIVVMVASKQQGDGSIGWDPLSLVRPIPLLVILAVFVGCFFGEFRRASR